MPYLARLVAITKVAAVTREIIPFIHFQAQQKGVEVTDDTKVAILQVENIPSYHIVFLDTEISIEDLEEELEKNDTKLARETRALLAKQMKSRK
ncbi:MAG: DUF749 family protein [Methanomassiliicoccales archaeon]|nr:MAG: DUF749 family protein [Methanomassiliicoccales archaeon]